MCCKASCAGGAFGPLSLLEGYCSSIDSALFVRSPRVSLFNLGHTKTLIPAPLHKAPHIGDIDGVEIFAGVMVPEWQLLKVNCLAVVNLFFPEST